jgi:hypothetical protein
LKIVRLGPLGAGYYLYGIGRGGRREERRNGGASRISAGLMFTSESRETRSFPNLDGLLDFYKETLKRPFQNDLARKP